MVLASSFRRAVQRTGWIMSTTDAYFPDAGDTLADSGTFFIGIHKGSTADHNPVNVVSRLT